MEESKPAPSENLAQNPVPRATGFWRWFYIVAGILCVGMAYLGVMLPGLPATPWVLLASFCFARSSYRLQRWLRASPLFGRLIRDWEDHRGVRKSVKVVMVSLVIMACSFSIGLAPIGIWLKWLIAGCGLTGISVILFVVPTIRAQRLP